MIDLVDVILLDCRRQLDWLGDISRDEIHLVQHVADPLSARIAVEEHQVLPRDSLFPYEMPCQVRTQEARPASNHYRHLGILLRISMSAPEHKEFGRHRRLTTPV